MSAQEWPIPSLNLPATPARPAAMSDPYARYRVGALRPAVLVGVAVLVGLEVWALLVGYGLRVTSDTPTFLALLRDQAVSPLVPVSPFLAASGVETSHATPYTQALAWLWNALAPHHDSAGAPLPSPVSAYRFLGGAGIVITLVLLHACFVWARREAGPRAAWLSIPVLLLLFGPAHVIWAGDLTFHGFLYAAYYPQTLALALLLYALVAIDAPLRSRRTAIAMAAVAATMVVHPFTGALLSLLIAANGAALVLRRQPDWQLGSVALLGGFGLASLWPAYSLGDALAIGGPPGLVLVSACAVLPPALRVILVVRPVRSGVAAVGRTVGGLHSPRHLAFVLAAAGLVAVVALGIWETWLLLQPNPDPLVHSNRLALYWVEDRWRWPLMFGAGAVGLSGLVSLARAGRALPALWFASCASVGLAGIAGAPLPVWWRFLLFCQLPLALGVGEALVGLVRDGAESAGAATLFRRGRAGSSARAAVVVVATFAFVLAFKLVTLVGVSDRFTYFGSEPQQAYSLGSVVPKKPGLVATDPFTAYYLPAATGHRVLTVTKAHVGSAHELRASQAGYRLLHDYATGANWWEAARQMWRRHVRYVVIEKQTSLRPPTLAEFSTGPTPLVRTTSDRRWLGSYFYRNNRVGTLLYDSPTYVVYRLEKRKLWP